MNLSNIQQLRYFATGAERMAKDMRTNAEEAERLAKSLNRDADLLEKQAESYELELPNKAVAEMLGVTVRRVQQYKAEGTLRSTRFIDVFKFKQERR